MAVDEDELSWNWRKSDLARQLGATEGQEDRPAKRQRRIKGWREHEDNSWGQVELEDTGVGSINSWLLKDKNPEPGQNGSQPANSIQPLVALPQLTKVTKQMKLKPWSWLELEAGKVVLDLVREAYI